MNTMGIHSIRRVGLAIATFAAFLLLTAPSVFAFERCPNEAVRAESNTDPATGQAYSVGLPECRAYEMVSPLDKQAHSALDGAVGGPLVTPEGNAIGFVSEGAFANTENFNVHGFAGPQNTYIARRTANGWATEAALAPVSVISLPTIDGFDGDASLDLSTRATCGNVGDVSTANGTSPNFACAIRSPQGTWAETPAYTDLTGEPPKETTLFWGSSSDLSDIVWQPYNLGLLPGDSAVGGSAIYETTGLGTGSPQLRIVSVDNEGTPLTTDGGNAGPYLGDTLGGTPTGDVYQAVSSDGQTVYFTAEPSGGGCLTLYARTGDFAGGTSSSPTTVEIGCGAIFVGASADGSKVFFTTTQRLAGTDTDNSSDLYEYDFDSSAGHHYIQVSAGGLGDPSSGSGAEVESHNVVGISSDGSHIYFSSAAVLTTLPNGNGQHAVQGDENLYGYDTETQQTQFVGSGPVASFTAQVTPTGRYLILATTAHLSSEDTNSGSAVYRYDFETGELTWISHPVPGFPRLDEGDNSELPVRDEEAKIGAMAYYGDAERAISEDGEYVIFSTAEKLASNDVNSGSIASQCDNDHANTTAGCDVYLWHNGTVSLISDGTNPAGVTEPPSMSATGSDIVFPTTSQLTGQDTDQLQDIYDARIDGGFPTPTPEPSCSGEACQGSQSSSPTFGTPGSQSFTGGGNQTAPPFKEVLEPETKPKSKPLTNAQKLAKALKTCRTRNRLKKQRLLCERVVRKRYASAGRRTGKRMPSRH
jgi:hypothetical protein